MAVRRSLRSTDFSQAFYERHANMCKVFSNAVRLRILNTVGVREMSVAQIAERLKVPLGTVSPHLLMMKHRGMLISRREGNQIFYRLANPKILQAFGLIREILSEQMKQEDLLQRELEQLMFGRRRKL